jgi:hypothetical protein
LGMFIAWRQLDTFICTVWAGPCLSAVMGVCWTGRVLPNLPLAWPDGSECTFGPDHLFTSWVPACPWNSVAECIDCITMLAAALTLSQSWSNCSYSRHADSGPQRPAASLLRQSCRARADEAEMAGKKNKQRVSTNVGRSYRQSTTQTVWMADESSDHEHDDMLDTPVHIGNVVWVSADGRTKVTIAGPGHALTFTRTALLARARTTAPSPL